jgi:aryl carrier-like protein
MTGIADRLRHAFASRATDDYPFADDTNFFEAGLTSLRLAELVDELRSAGINVTLLDVFRYPTLRELSDELARRSGDVLGVSRPPWQA